MMSRSTTRPIQPPGARIPRPTVELPDIVRQLIITGLGRDAPTVIVTDDELPPVIALIEHHARRMTIEQRLAEILQASHADARATNWPGMTADNPILAIDRSRCHRSFPASNADAQPRWTSAVDRSPSRRPPPGYGQ
jgi:hypothetical protein